MDETKARQLLEKERLRLEDLKDTFALRDLEVESEQESVDELSSVDQHPADLGTETFEREKEESILNSVEGQLADVERAFARLEEGTYGRCEVCGKPIPDERLEARPAARYCLEHQEWIERGGSG
ncbi:MAG: TraR/DksA C4-type zinc finger protein [Actinomycetota bacterium]|nr:TraR/DksA C4-type zinc finger protein [Actinomycetota bacterium]